MNQAHLEMTGNLGSIRPTGHEELERDVQTVRERADAFARLPLRDRIALLRACGEGVARVAPAWVAAACRAKGIDPSSALAGEEWLGGPVITARSIRLLTASLLALARDGRVPLGAGVERQADGRLRVRVFPANAQDGAMFPGFRCYTLLQEGIDEQRARELQAAFYKEKDPKGRVSVILGAGNVASIPPLDTVYKMFVEGAVAVLKMNPVNEYLGPFLADALAPLLKEGYLRIAYGGGDAGGYLCRHPLVDDIHITGSDVTHDLIVWGPPGPERERRKRENDPVLKKTISSELGNVSPIVIAPAAYGQRELWFQARNVASMVQNNGSFNCNAGKMLVVSAAWSQRQEFLGMLRRAFEQMPLRKAYYPGAAQRYETLLEGHPQVERFGAAKDGELPWALVPGLDPRDESEKLFQVEPFCGILSETALPAADPAEFLQQAAAFCNDRLWGTLNACIVVPPRLQEGAAGAALERAIADLRYGAIGINHWPALVYGFGSPPWGGHPSATLHNIQSGLGWVHNTYMLGGIDKTVLYGPLVVSPKPAWFYDNRRTHDLGRRLLAFETSPSWLKIPAIAITALRG